MSGSSVPKLRKALKASSPGRHYEQECWDLGHANVAGVDEVGRGAWAGPLTVAAAVIPRERRIYKVRDSKMLTEAERESLYDRIIDWCEAWGVGHASEVECDELGMSAAQKLAAKRAIEGLGVEVDHVLLDGKWDFVGGSTTMIVKGDAKSLSIAAASIIAKVTRDRMMRAMAGDHPGFFFEDNKGYPCPRHRAALAEVGPAVVHRHSWAFVDGLPRNEVVLRRRQGSLFDLTDVPEGTEAVNEP
ncbi:MAG: ribonuclease HII [Actinomycetota bacterium]